MGRAIVIMEFRFHVHHGRGGTGGGIIPHVDAEGFDAHNAGGDEMDRPENAERLAAFGKAGVGGVGTADPGEIPDIGGFIGADRNDVGGAIMDEVSDIEGEGGAAAGVLAGGLAIHPDSGVGTYPFEIQKHAAATFGGIHSKRVTIPGAAVEVAVEEAMHAAVVVPVVWYGYGLPGVVIEGGR